MLNHIIKISFICSLLLLTACAAQPDGKRQARDLLYKLEKQAALAYRNKNWKVAEEKYGLLISESPNTAEIWFRLGNIYARTSRPEKAIAAYKEAVVRQADYQPAWRNLGILSLRKTAHLYIEMLLHLEHDSESYIRAKKTSEVLLRLIKKNQSKTMIQEAVKAETH